MMLVIHGVDKWGFNMAVCGLSNGGAEVGKVNKLFTGLDDVRTPARWLKNLRYNWCKNE